MRKPKYYFESEDAETCHTLDYFIESAEPDATEITIMKAIKDTETTDYIWCMSYQAVGERSECGNSCPGYKPRNGKSGICSNKGQLYLHGEWVTIPLS